MAEPMAVEAPTLADSNPAGVARLPHVGAPALGVEENGRKRALEDAEGDASGGRGADEIKKHKTGNNGAAQTGGIKRKNVVASSDENDSGDDDVPLGKPVSKGRSGAGGDAGKGIAGKAGGTTNGTGLGASNAVRASTSASIAKSASSRSNGTADGASNGKGAVKPASNGAAASKRAPTSKPPSIGSKPPSKRSAAAGQAKRYNEDTSSDDDVPLAKSAGAGKRGKPAAAAGPSSGSSSSEDDRPLKRIVKKEAVRPAKKLTAAAVKEEEPASSSSDDDVPLAKKAKAKAAPKKASAAAAKVTAEPGKPAKKVKVENGPAKKEDGEEEEGGFKWWLQKDGDQEGRDEDDSIKWTTLEHNGVMFPPPYIPLPKNVKMRYDGKVVDLPPEAEEVAGFFAALLETEHAQDKTFRANFFRDWQTVMKTHPPRDGTRITSLDKCDFRPMYDYFEIQKQLKKGVPAAEKKALKAAKDEAEKAYTRATIDGRKELVGNFRVEPPGLFRGRGEHPKKGTFKFRLAPEDIVINIGEGVPIPVPNIPGQWKKIQHDRTVTWLAHWKENVNGNSKYVFLGAGSAWKGQSDRIKFEKARQLHKHVDAIRKDYTAEMKSKVMAERQRATAMYLIDRLALRAGNEKGEEEADTVGCCSLRLEHVTLLPPSSIELRFPGKDSIMYEQEVEVDPQVFKNIKIFKQDKEDEDQLFDRVDTSGLNKHLNNYMKGLTAKVFRTYNASYTFQKQLVGTPENGTVAQKVSWYNKANKEVAILCNHQKTVSKGHATSMEKLGDKLRGIKYQRMKLRAQLMTMDPKNKKRHPELVDDESDLDDDFFERHEAATLEQMLDKAQKKFEKDKAKAAAEGAPALPETLLKDKLAEIKEEHKVFVRERKTRKVEPKKSSTEAKVLEAIKKIDERISTFKGTLEDRESNKTVALGTSKINYIDPRLSVAWAKQYNVPLEKLFSKTLIHKFPWAIAEVEDDPDFMFC